MLFEMHAHTTRYSACGKMDPEEYIDTAREMAIGGLCFTEHNTFWDEDEIERLRRYAGDIVLINGNEQRCWEGDFIQGDFLVYGCRFRIERPEIHELVKIVHEKGGIIIAAHPFREMLGISAELISEIDLDGLEVHSSNQEPWQTGLAKKIAKERNLALVAGSDAHRSDYVGYSLTDFTAEIKDEKDLVRAIKNKQIKLVPHE